MMKFLVFSDYHYWKGHYPQSADGIHEILKRAADEKVDFVIHCGDLCHNAPTAPELVEAYVNNKYCIPALGCLGNHEVEAADSLDEVLTAYKMPHNFYYTDIKGYRVIVLDTNYYLTESGELLHNPPHSHSRPNGDRLTPEQLEWLDSAIGSAEGQCLIFSHASFEQPCGSPQSKEFREVIGRHRGKVLMCVNGHHHTDSLSFSDNVIWFDVNATYNVFWEMMDNPYYSEEFKKTARMTKNCCFSADPLSAIVTIDDGRVKVDGKKSEYLYGVSPEMIGYSSPNRFGRYSCTKISSAEFLL